MESVPPWLQNLVGRLRERPQNPVRVLEAEIAGLETGLAAAERQLVESRAAASEVEHVAMDAIRTGNDHLARAALLEQKTHAETVARLEADILVLRALLDESREFLAGLPPADLDPSSR
jgi:phage shock protein A